MGCFEILELRNRKVQFWEFWRAKREVGFEKLEELEAKMGGEATLKSFASIIKENAEHRTS